MILVVDDEPDSCLVYQIVLEDAGFHCISYTDSVKALQEFKPSFYDLVLLDIKMPVLNGFELWKKIREVESTIEIIFITALPQHFRTYDTDNHILNSQLSNAITYIQKPIENKELVKKVTEILRKGNTDWGFMDIYFIIQRTIPRLFITLEMNNM